MLNWFSAAEHQHSLVCVFQLCRLELVVGTCITQAAARLAHSFHLESQAVLQGLMGALAGHGAWRVVLGQHHTPSAPRSWSVLAAACQLQQRQARSDQIYVRASLVAACWGLHLSCSEVKLLCRLSMRSHAQRAQPISA